VEQQDLGGSQGREREKGRTKREPRVAVLLQIIGGRRAMEDSRGIKFNTNQAGGRSREKKIHRSARKREGGEGE